MLPTTNPPRPHPHRARPRPGSSRLLRPRSPSPSSPRPRSSSSEDDGGAFFFSPRSPPARAPRTLHKAALVLLAFVAVLFLSWCRSVVSVTETALDHRLDFEELRPETTTVKEFPASKVTSKPPLPLNPGPRPWLRFFDAAPVHVHPPDPPADDPFFKGTLPLFWGGGGPGKDGKSRKNKDGPLDGVRTVTRPPHIDKIVGLVFYGRRMQVSILDCYLRRNLVKNGGVLDEVIFLSRTRDPGDLEWLDKLTADEPAYARHRWDGKRGFTSSYQMIRNDTIYVKLDDDIVFVDDAAIPTLVDTLINHPEYYLIGANVVNQPMLSWVHWRLGAVRPFLPELRPFVNGRPDGRTEWRTSHLPGWNGSDEFVMPIDWQPPITPAQVPSENEIASMVSFLPPPPTSTRTRTRTRPALTTWTWTTRTTPYGDDYYIHATPLHDNPPAPPPPRPTATPDTPPTAERRDDVLQYRWLPLRGLTRHDMDSTPVRSTTFDAFGPGWNKWPVGAQEHYSFFTNLEAGELWRYKFDVWDFNYDRMGIQFIAMWGSDINGAKPIDKDDERHFSQTMTKLTGRHGVVDGRALVAHYSFNQQRRGMQTTDVLERYRTFAKEHICLSPMLYP